MCAVRFAPEVEGAPYTNARKGLGKAYTLPLWLANDLSYVFERIDFSKSSPFGGWLGHCD